MTVAGGQFSEAIAELYDRYMVPMLFEPYALDLAERMAMLGPRRVLETAAGTGILTRIIAASLPGATSIVATDLNAAMLDRARRMCPDDDRISWQQADALALPFEGPGFDAVACQFGAMFFPDKVAGFREARRVLTAGGAFVFNVWDRIEANDFALAVTEALAAMFPEDPPDFMARIPHGYFDQESIRAHLLAAGFADVTIEPIERPSAAASARDVAIAYCQGTPFRTQIESRDAARLDEATGRAAELLERRFGRGPVSARSRAFVVTARG